MLDYDGSLHDIVSLLLDLKRVPDHQNRIPDGQVMTVLVCCFCQFSGIIRPLGLPPAREARDHEGGSTSLRGCADKLTVQGFLG
jgi:hypothetical protein